MIRRWVIGFKGSGSLKAVDYEDQLGLEEKGGEDINGARAISGASVKWNPGLVLAVLRGPCGPCGLRLVGLGIPRNIPIIGEFNINTALACSFSSPIFPLTHLSFLNLSNWWNSFGRWSLFRSFWARCLPCLPTCDMDIYWSPRHHTCPFGWI